MFELEEYRRAGSAFWPDRWCRPVELLRLLGRPGGEHGGAGAQPGAAAAAAAPPQAESGQFLFDRRRHADVLEWLLFLNAHDEFTYRYAHGDKDTYRAAFGLASKAADYWQVAQPLSLALAPGLLLFTPRGFIQHHPNGSLAFVHRTSHAKYDLRSAASRGFTRALLQPDCHWNERNWHFFAPTPLLWPRRVLTESRCDLSLYDPSNTGDKCRQRPDRPAVIEVAPTSYVGRAQAAADAAYAMFSAHAADRPDVYPSRSPGGGAWSIALGATVALLAACCVCLLLVWRPASGRRAALASQPSGLLSSSSGLLSSKLSQH
jgi:hypothetical protein